MHLARSMMARLALLVGIGLVTVGNQRLQFQSAATDPRCRRLDGSAATARFTQHARSCASPPASRPRASCSASRSASTSRSATAPTTPVDAAVPRRADLRLPRRRPGHQPRCAGSGRDGHGVRAGGHRAHVRAQRQQDLHASPGTASSPTARSCRPGTYQARGAHGIRRILRPTRWRPANWRSPLVTFTVR